MLRSACALIAVLAAVLAWPAFAQVDDNANAGSDDEMTSEDSAADDADADKADTAEADKPDAEDEDKADADAEEADDDSGHEIDYHRSGPYFGLAGTWGIEKFDGLDNANVDDSIGINARAGYRVLSWLSGELEGEYMFDFNIDGNNTNFDSDLALWLIGPNVRLNLPTDLIQPYALIGGGYMGADFSGDSNDTEHGGFARMGFGVEFYPWEHIAIDSGITYVVPVGDDIDDLKFLSIHWGLLYRF